ncbi:hypothetical protein NDU88_006583, partial [Pleurodeles waltl]
ETSISSIFSSLVSSSLSPFTYLSLPTSPTPMELPAHSFYSQQDNVDPWDLYDPDPISDNNPDCYPSKPSPPEDST